MQFVAGLSLGREEVVQWNPENCSACLSLVFEYELKKRSCGGLPSQACRPALQWTHPHPSEKFSGGTELNIDPSRTQVKLDAIG